MRYFTFLKPLFTQGALYLLALVFILDLLVFLTLGSIAAWWAVSVLQIIVVVAYIGVRNMRNPDHIPWKFAYKWWPEEEVRTK